VAQNTHLIFIFWRKLQVIKLAQNTISPFFGPIDWHAGRSGANYNRLVAVGIQSGQFFI
jgi:hypothetical protein